MAEDSKTIQKNTIQYVLLDTNIIHYFSDKNASRAYAEYLIELVNRGFGLAISDITIYELLRGAYNDKKNELLDILNLFQRFYLTDRVLIAAAELETLYNIEKVNKLEDGDKLIASTAILTGSLILTANFRDYPLPFFVEVERKIISYDFNGRPKTLPTLLLMPDLNIINTKFNEAPKK